MLYQKELENLIIEKITSFGLIEVKPAHRPRKSVHAFWDPNSNRKYITYNSGYIQVEKPRMFCGRVQSFGATMSPLNPQEKIFREYSYGTFEGRKYIMIPTEIERLMRILHILEHRQKKQEKQNSLDLVNKVLMDRWGREAVKK